MLIASRPKTHQFNSNDQTATQKNTKNLIETQYTNVNHVYTYRYTIHIDIEAASIIGSRDVGGM